jgi:hypothetical protein
VRFSVKAARTHLRHSERGAKLGALSPVITALAQLNELVDDTFMAVGSEAYTAALSVYQFMH